MTDSELQAIRDRLEAATPDIEQSTIIAGVLREGTGDPYLKFIAHAPTDIAALIAEVERLRGENSYLDTLICEARDGHDWEDYDEPDKSVAGRWQRCTVCKASRLLSFK